MAKLLKLYGNCGETRCPFLAFSLSPKIRHGYCAIGDFDIVDINCYSDQVPIEDMRFPENCPLENCED